MTKKLLTKVSTGVTTGALLVGFMVPAAFASTTVHVVHNGALSINNAFVSNTNTSSKTQTNITSVSNTVNTTTRTGGNTNSFNTGGGSSIDTGAATATVHIHNVAGLNLSVDPSCGCLSGD